MNLTITIENPTPANDVAMAPLHFGFNQGVFDVFNVGSTATAPIISVAEGGEIYRIGFAVSPVPEPQTYALMLGGLAVTAWLARCRQPSQVITAA